MPMRPWFLVLLWFFSATSLNVALSAERNDARPNVVIVITDDQGYGDLSCHGNPVLKTPQLDELAKCSVRLTDYHVAPTCSPTRAALQSGHWTNRTGAWHTILGRSMIRVDEPTIGQVFSNAGYATGMFGKWHLGDNYPYRPEDRGFEEVLRHGGGGVGQTPDFWDNAYFDGTYFRNGKPEPVQGYCTDVFFESAKQFIREQKSQGRPFLAYIATNAPHGPFHAPEEFSRPFRDTHGVALANFYGMIANIDHNVGNLRRFLRDEGLADNTIFLFTTDNGTAAGEKVFNARMRGKKGSPYDGGHRVPLFLHWPEGGYDQPVDIHPATHAVDVLPTLMDMCGIENRSDIQFDGRSILPLLKGSDDEAWNERILVTDSQRVKDPVKWKSSCVFTSRWRLINGKELYDIDADPGQRLDVAAEHADVVSRLREFYERWWSELEPTFSRPTEIYLGDPAENPSTLTCHDWITNGATPWNQAAIRRGVDRPNMTGFWYVKVTRPGTYRIELRRWPKETDAAINDGMKPGDPVPGTKAFRETPGRAFQFDRAKLTIAGQTEETELKPGSKSAVFEMELPAGSTRLTARFLGPDDVIAGAYYAYVQRVGPGEPSK